MGDGLWCGEVCGVVYLRKIRPTQLWVELSWVAAICLQTPPMVVHANCLDQQWQSTFVNVTMGATHKMPGPILHKLHTVGFTPDVLIVCLLSVTFVPLIPKPKHHSQRSHF